jgi:subtilisin family serine protease
MPSSKLDGPLAARVHEWDTAAEPRQAERITVLVHVTGDLAAVEAAGLWTELRIGDIVIGTVEVGDLDSVADLDDVASVQSNRETVPHLHDSAPEMHAPQARAVPPGFTGRNVIVGVVDSGIDVFHQAFRKPDGTTRIVSLLDLTLRDTITMTGAPTGGSIQLSWQPPTPPAAPGTLPVPPPIEPTTQVAIPCTAAQVQAALVALPSIDPADIVVTGGPLPATPIVIDLAGRYSGAKVDSSTLAPVVLKSKNLTGGTAPTVTIAHGRQFTPAEINAALAGAADQFPSSDTARHGTHVAGIAAGDGSQAGNCHGTDYYVGIAPEADLAIVHTTRKTADNLRGFHHIFEQPWRAAGDPIKPAVVNFSLGSQLGAHDGTAADEIALDSMLLVTTGRAIVISAGNDGELYDQAHPEKHPESGGGQHAFKTVPANGSATLGVVIQAGDRADDLFDIWYAGTGQLTFNVTTPNPGGVSLKAVVQPNGLYSDPLAGHPVSIQSTLNNAPSGRHNISFLLQPPAGGQISPGTWTITLAETQGTATPFDCWINLELTDPHPRFVNLDQNRSRTVTTPGTAHNVITVGAYSPADGKLAEFSSRGPTADGRIKPDLSAPGVAITAALAGAGTTVCCDCCCDFYVAKDGTSMAAPHVTGVVALMLQADPTLTFTEIRDKLVAGCRAPDPGAGPPVPNNDFGAGKVNAEASVIAAKPPAVTRVGATPVTDADERVVLAATAYPDAYLPVRTRLHELQRRVQGSPAGELMAALISEHVDEIRRLIDTERRVVVAWHRMHGPILLRLMLGDVRRDVLLPRTLGGRPVATGLARLLDELARVGSPGLAADIATHRAFLLALPGSALTDLEHHLRVS